MARISPQGVRDLNVVIEVLHENGAVNSPSMGERYNLGGRVALVKGTPGGWWGDWELNYKDQMTFEEYKKALDIDKNPSGLEKAEGGRIDMKPGGIVEPGVTNYGKTATSRKYIEKGIYRRDNGNYRLVANREGAKKLDKTLPKGSTLEDARKALSAWEKANPIKVKWKEGQKIKIITEGPKGKQVNVDIKYKTPKIEADFKAAMADFAGENKAGWSTAKFENTFGGIAGDAMQFVREQEPTFVRDVNKVQTLKYADELEELGHKDWNAAIKAGDDKLVMSHRWQKLNPYEPKGFDTSRNQLAKNIENLNIFEKSGQTLEDFYDLFKDRTFKANLRAYMKGEAGPFVTEAWDEAGFKSKYKNIMPKLKKHLEVWHDIERNFGKTKAQIKKAKVREFSKLDIENLIRRAKRVGRTDYLNQLDLAHRQDLIIDQNISELGIERPEINRVLIKDAEIERNKLHKKNYALIEEVKKGKNIQKNLSFIAENNHRIKQISEITKGRLTGIIIDTETLAPVKLQPSNIMGVDAGLFNKPIKEMTEAEKIYLKDKILPTVIKEARAMTPKKIASELMGIIDDPVLSEKLEARISKLKTGKHITKPVFEQSQKIYSIMEDLKKLPANERDRISIAVGCKPRGRKAEGGRIGFAGGSVGMLTCIDAKWEKNPKGFFRATANIASKGLDKLWKYASPMFLPAVQIGLGRAEHFKDPTSPEMWWDIILASDAVKRWGLDKATLSQLKNASWVKRADIVGKLILRGGSNKILEKMNWVAKRAVAPAELYQGYKGFQRELDLVKKYAKENNIPYEKAKMAYLFSGSAAKWRWNRASLFKMLGFGTMGPKLMLQASNSEEFQAEGKKIYEFLKEYEDDPVDKEPVKKEVTEEVSHGTGPENWAINIKEQMDKKQIAENQPIGVNRYMQLIK